MVSGYPVLEDLLKDFSVISGIIQAIRLESTLIASLDAYISI